MRYLLPVLCLGLAVSAAEQLKPIAIGGETPWQMERGERRDPFTMSLPVVLPAKEEIPPPQKEYFAEKTAQIQQQQILAEEALLEGDVDRALQHCDRALDMLKECKIIPREFETLPRLRRAAETLKARRDAEAAFEQLKLEVHGIVAQPAASLAIVNNTVVSRGACVNTAGGDVLLIEEIRGDCVVLRFHGFKMAAAIKQR